MQQLGVHGAMYQVIRKCDESNTIRLTLIGSTSRLPLDNIISFDAEDAWDNLVGRYESNMRQK